VRYSTLANFGAMLSNQTNWADFPLHFRYYLKQLGFERGSSFTIVRNTLDGGPPAGHSGSGGFNTLNSLFYWQSVFRVHLSPKLLFRRRSLRLIIELASPETATSVFNYPGWFFTFNLALISVENWINASAVVNFLSANWVQSLVVIPSDMMDV